MANKHVAWKSCLHLAEGFAVSTHLIPVKAVCGGFDGFPRCTEARLQPREVSCTAQALQGFTAEAGSEARCQS